MVTPNKGDVRGTTEGVNMALPTPHVLVSQSTAVHTGLYLKERSRNPREYETKDEVILLSTL